MSDPDTSSTGPSGDPAGSSGSAGPTGNWRDMRRAERDARRADRHAWRAAHPGMAGPGWNGLPIGAIVLIVIGVVFLLGNFGFHLPSHWWAVLVLIPAVSLLVAAIRFYRVDHTFSGRAMGPAIGGVVLLAMALAIFFGLNWGLFWPIVLIAAGLAIIARRSGFRS